jgi:hypothetical protein
VEVQAREIGVIWPVHGGFCRQPSSARWTRMERKGDGRRRKKGARDEEEWTRARCVVTASLMHIRAP